MDFPRHVYEKAINHQQDLKDYIIKSRYQKLPTTLRLTSKNDHTVYKWKPEYWIFQMWSFLKNCDISQFWIIFGYVKNSQVTHRSYVLSHFLRESVSERIERIERGAMIEKYFYEEFGMESLKFKGTNDEFKAENYVYL